MRAMMEYFTPLKQWLDQQNKGQKIGWTSEVISPACSSGKPAQVVGFALLARLFSQNTLLKAGQTVPAC